MLPLFFLFLFLQNNTRYQSLNPCLLKPLLCLLPGVQIPEHRKVFLYDRLPALPWGGRYDQCFSAIAYLIFLAYQRNLNINYLSRWYAVENALHGKEGENPTKGGLLSPSERPTVGINQSIPEEPALTVLKTLKLVQSTELQQCKASDWLWS